MSLMHRIMDKLFGPPPKVKRAVEENSEAVRRLKAALDKECSIPGAIDDLAYPRKKKNG
jgi:hypothetical protein